MDVSLHRDTKVTPEEGVERVFAATRYQLLQWMSSPPENQRQCKIVPSLYSLHSQLYRINLS